VARSGSSRLNVVGAKAEQWADALIDFGPRNTVLHYRDTKTTTLDLAGSQPEALSQFLSGRKTRLATLLRGKEDHATASVRARNLRRKMVELDEEQGVEAGRLARGLLRVAPPTTKGTTPIQPLRAPLLLQGIELEPRTAAENDYTIDLRGEVEVNPVLLYALNRQYGVDLEADRMADELQASVAEVEDPSEQVKLVYQALADLVGRHNLSVELEDRVLIGLFSFEKLPMVNDLRNSADLLASHDVIAAAAGFAPAVETLHADVARYQAVEADDVHPRDEFLVMDADSSQQRAISAVLGGQHVVIQGPPGTGKSQTIANIIAAAAAQGRRILFVAEKRAAIEAVTERLEKVDLHHLVFDLHEQKLSKKQVAEQVAKSLDRASKELPPRIDGLHDRLVERRQQVIEHSNELHADREPWNASAFQVYEELLDLPVRAVSQVRFRGSQLRTLGGEAIRHVVSDLMDFVDKGGLRIRRGDSPWSMSEVRDMNAVEEVLAKLDALVGRPWQDAQSEMRALVGRAGLNRPFDLSGWQETLSLLGAVEKTVGAYGEEIFGAHLDDLCYSTAPRSWRSGHPRDIGCWRRRSLRKQAAQMRVAGKGDRATLHRELLAAAAQRDRWQQLAIEDGMPSQVVGLGGAVHRFTEIRDQLAAVAMCARLEDPEKWPEEQVTSTVAMLNADRNTLHLMPSLNTLSDRFRALGLDALLDELARRNADADEARDVLWYSWYRSLLDEYRLRVPHLASFVGRQHSRIVDEFRQADSDHFRLNAQRVRRSVAEQLRAARDTNPQQNTVVLGEAKRKRGHMPIRKLVAKAPDVLLAARPCWAMSPIVVSRLLPAERLFDLVIFDEASQVEPYDAMASIMRGRQLVVAGDERQLPPTTFFRSTLQGGSGEENDDEDDTPSALQVGDFESILKCLATFVPQSHTLIWHYRSQDERLIAFSNHEIYNGALVTFPGREAESPLRLDVVDGRAAPGQGGIAHLEVDRVVELAVRHAREHPAESLGVITMGLKHANHVEGALRQASQRHPELAEFTGRMHGPGRRLFVKSLERVQGDERDAIILSIGYSKGPDGRLPMRFGPLNQEGGERRLNVAVTRARRRMTVVSSFTHHDMVPNWGTLGPELLRQFLAFAENGGRLEEIGGAEHVELNGFERSVLAALENAGIRVIPQWGVSGFRIDFALAHPEQPGRMVLAVEADGDTYHRATSARDRDRLRQEHLERLGWQFHRIWASDWFDDPDAATARIVEHWHRAIAEENRDPEPATPICAEPVEEVAVEADRGPRPRVPRRGKIDEYDDREIVTVCRWLLADRLPLDRETRIDQALQELGFQRRGKKIVERINVALDRAGRLVMSEER
jgi:very-short-patch-repair endonuclease